MKKIYLMLTALLAVFLMLSGCQDTEQETGEKTADNGTAAVETEVPEETEKRNPADLVALEIDPMSYAEEIAEHEYYKKVFDGFHITEITILDRNTDISEFEYGGTDSINLLVTSVNEDESIVGCLEWCVYYDCKDEWVRDTFEPVEYNTYNGGTFRALKEPSYTDEELGAMISEAAEQPIQTVTVKEHRPDLNDDYTSWDYLTVTGEAQHTYMSDFYDYYIKSELVSGSPSWNVVSAYIKEEYEKWDIKGIYEHREQGALTETVIISVSGLQNNMKVETRHDAGGKTYSHLYGDIQSFAGHNSLENFVAWNLFEDRSRETYDKIVSEHYSIEFYPYYGTEEEPLTFEYGVRASIAKDVLFIGKDYIGNFLSDAGKYKVDDENKTVKLYVTEWKRVSTDIHSEEAAS